MEENKIMDTKLLWVADSPFSRATKWLLLNNEVAHCDHLMTWEEMATDELLRNANSKQQVPTLLVNGDSFTDSLLIAMDYLPADWHKSADAKLFRLADSDVESAIIFLFRANLLATKFGQSNESQLMYESGVSTFKSAVDHLLDDIWRDRARIKVSFGLVLLYSTLLAASSLSGVNLIEYRIDELKPLFCLIEQDKDYQKMITSVPAGVKFEVPFMIMAHKG